MCHLSFSDSDSLRVTLKGKLEGHPLKIEIVSATNNEPSKYLHAPIFSPQNAYIHMTLWLFLNEFARPKFMCTLTWLIFNSKNSINVFNIMFIFALDPM